MSVPGASVVLRNVSVEYVRRDRFWIPRARIRALEAVDLEIRAGRILGIAGISGCGKSTLARCAARWMRPDSGEVLGATPQMVMQDAGGSLNPLFTAFEVVEEPLRIQNRDRDRALVEEFLDSVGLLN